MKTPGLHDRDGVDKADIFDPIHPHQGQHDPAARGHAATHRSAAAHLYRNFTPRGELKSLLTSICERYEGQQLVADALRHLSPLCAQRFGIISNGSVAEDFSKLRSKLHRNNVAPTGCRASAPLAKRNKRQAMRLPYNSSADRNSIMPRLLHPCNERLGGKNHWLTFVVARELLDAVRGIGEEV